MADVAAAEMALQRLWLRLRGWCRRPVVSLDDIEVVGLELREIEMGLAAAHRGLQEQRRLVE